MRSVTNRKTGGHGGAALFCTLAMLAGTTGATDYGEKELRSVAVRNGDGKIAVNSDGHADWGDGKRSADKTFDGDSGTYYDPKSAASDTWTGYWLTEPRIVTRVRLYGYPPGDDPATRMRLATIQGATRTQDWTDAVPIRSLKDCVSSDWKTNPFWIEALPQFEAVGKAVTGVRVFQPKPSSGNGFAGNLAELEVYGMDETSFKAFDGNLETELALAAFDTVGRDFGVSVSLSKVRFVAGANAAGLVDGRFEVSSTANFASPTIVHTITEAPEAGVVTEVTCPAVSGRYVRFIAIHDCALAEVDFIPSSAPTKLVAPAANTDQSATLTWHAAAGMGGCTRIERAFGAGGPWATVADLTDGQCSWHDDDPAAVGVPCYYRVSALASFCGERVPGASAELIVRNRALRLLERDRSDMTHLRSGVSIIYKYGGTVWTPATSTTAEGVQKSVMISFDNKVSADSGYGTNYSDLKSVSPRTCLGLDFGENPCYVSFMRLYFGRTGGDSEKNRIAGAVLSGSNSVGHWNENDQFTDLFAPLTNEGLYRWYERTCSPTGPWRYLFIHNERDNGWGCNSSELQFFGWFASDLKGKALGVNDLKATDNGDGTLTLNWTVVDGSEGTFAIERKVGEGDWADMASGVTGTSWTDEDFTAAGGLHAYRVRTENGDVAAYSETVEKTSYAHGAGVGLHGVWYSSYKSTDVGETIDRVTTNGTIDVELADGQTDTLVKWSGRLIVPLDGSWTFDAEVDDTLTLWIDDQPVLYRPALNGTTQKNTITLTAGEHAFLAKYYQNAGTGVCRLYWSGPIGREIIPSTQFIPVATDETLPEPWAGARSFSGTTGRLPSADVRVRDDGSFDFAFGGNDLYYAANDYCQLWQPITGDFTLKVRMEYIYTGTQNNSQKGGLMVRAGLDAKAAFEAYLVQVSGMWSGRFGGKGRSAYGKDIFDIWADGDKQSWQPKAEQANWLKLVREGQSLIFYAKPVGGGEWKQLFTRTLPDGFGETLYVGPVASGGDTTSAAIPSYYWNFSKFRLGQVGSMLIVR